MSLPASTWLSRTCVETSGECPISATVGTFDRLRRPAIGSDHLGASQLDQLFGILASSQCLEDVRAIRDKAEAARAYAFSAQLGLNLQNRAGELKLRAERKAGEMLRSLKLRGGDRRSKGHRVTLKLHDLGITRQQSKRWQRIAKVSEREFAEYVRLANEQELEVTSAALMRISACANGQVSRRLAKVSSRRRRVSNKQPGDALVKDLICELSNHCELVGNIVRLRSDEGDSKFTNAERRIAGRLLSEMHDLLKQIDKEWVRRQIR